MFWHNDARCREHDPDLFFSAGSRSERRAKAICERCPVREQCLSFAIESGTDFGVWGGTSSRERRVLRRLARSRPAPVAVGA
jgi:WhiB family redox-sensing transcriptional regulator